MRLSCLGLILLAGITPVQAELVDELISKQSQLVNAEKQRKIDEALPKPLPALPPAAMQAAVSATGLPLPALPEREPFVLAISRSGGFYMADIWHKGSVVTLSANQPYLSALGDWKLAKISPSQVELVRPGKGKSQQTRTLVLAQVAAGPAEDPDRGPAGSATLAAPSSAAALTPIGVPSTAGLR
ncbi:hypothetical protein [Parachitinimonas caeni]|uniref:Type IV pilus biogenesis protein PilP n=1 Tax=Parachitinimonas caeni TaxID=3031301 RepID=A0ABT7E5H9_9NEIS|nr:hypothetical protein [Parachitinimonas caeni]MDK2126715.1 hypothetical protein [Parachitinimonas caeni]